MSTSSFRLTQGERDLRVAPTDLLAYISEFLQIKRRKWRPKTLEVYTSILNLYAKHVGADHWPPTRRGVLSWLDALKASKVSDTTINTYWIHLRTFLNFLEKSGEISSSDNPIHQIVALELDPEPEDLPPVAFPTGHLGELFAHLEVLAAEDNLLAIRDLALLRLAYVTGLREGELATLTWEQIDFDRFEIRVEARRSKSKKPRPVYFDEQVCHDLTAWRAVRPSREGVQQVFVSLGGRNPHGSPIKPRALYRILQRWLTLVGITRRKFHALRHSSALDALDEGISVDKVQKQLGHASLETTLRYTRVHNEELARAYRERSLSRRLARHRRK